MVAIHSDDEVLRSALLLAVQMLGALLYSEGKHSKVSSSTLEVLCSLYPRSAGVLQRYMTLPDNNDEVLRSAVVHAE